MHKKDSSDYKSEYRNFPCDLCGSVEVELLPHVKEYTDGQLIHICKRCGFVYVKMRRSHLAIAQIWSEKLFGKSYTAKSPLMLGRHYYVAEFMHQNINLNKKRV
ncbi:MAG: hypothetical protein NT033_00345, partial [Candidatus Omnitrophica bacterium]|nr:hypothetical protein [Candidatus Omnitrophota bacterium]